MNIYYDKDADLSIIKSKKVAIIGYGSQGHAHANNLKESGVDVVIGLHDGSKSAEKARKSGFEVLSVSEATKISDLVMLLIPDENQADVYSEDVEPNLKEGASLGFAHGFNIHFETIKPNSDTNIIMIAPKGPGHLVRSTYSEGGGVPTLIAVNQDPSGNSKELALSYASANGGGKAGVIETTFKEETETDLFGEQVVLVGGIPKLIESAYNILTEFGYSPVTSWLVCYYELRTIVDMFHAKGFEYMGKAISDTAEYGGLTRGERLINDGVRDEMRGILTEIQNQTFFNEWNLESRNKLPLLNKLRNKESSSKIEEVGKQLLLELFKE